MEPLILSLKTKPKCGASKKFYLCKGRKREEGKSEKREIKKTPAFAAINVDALLIK